MGRRAKPKATPPETVAIDDMVVSVSPPARSRSDIVNEMKAQRARVCRFNERGDDPLVDPKIDIMYRQIWAREHENLLKDEARRNRSLLRRLIDAVMGA